jgi:hypothetical protein
MDDNTTKVLLELITAFSAIAAAAIAAFAYKRANDAVITSSKTHDLVNSRMTELLEITKTSAHAEGVIDGKAEGLVPDVSLRHPPGSTP